MNKKYPKLKIRRIFLRLFYIKSSPSIIFMIQNLDIRPSQKLLVVFEEKVNPVSAAVNLFVKFLTAQSCYLRALNVNVIISYKRT